MSSRRVPQITALAALFLAAFPWNASARSHKPRFGFQRFGAHYIGGYSVVAPTGTLAGPADIRIKATRDGRSASVTWKNTFYTPHGSYVVVIRWAFYPDGTLVANTLDPRDSQLSGIGSFTLDRNLPVTMSATSASGAAHMSGLLRLIGGGSLSITATLSGIPEGDATYTFSGSRKR